MIVYLNVVLLVDIVTCTPESEHNSTNDGEGRSSVATEPVLPQSSTSEPLLHASDQVFTHIYIYIVLYKCLPVLHC